MHPLKAERVPTPTIKDVARASGVSYKTVSRVINGEGPVRDESRWRVAAAIAATGYHPHPGARSMRLGRVHALRLLMKTGTDRFLLNPFQDDVVAGVVDTAARLGYAVMIELAGRPHHPDAALGLTERRVDGTVLLDSQTPCYLATQLAATGAPAVVIANRDLEPPLSWIHTDFCGGAEQLVNHLLALGHRRFAHITDNPSFLSTTERRRGYEQALLAAGITPDPGLIIRAGQLRHEGDQATERLLATGAPFTAIVCVNDLTALGAIDCLRRHGRNVPADVSVTGYDDIYLAQYTTPPLTTVRIPWYEMGAAATEMVIGAVEGTAPYPDGRVLPVDLRLRGTTGPVTR